MENTSFWMVYGLNQRAPTVRHKTEDSAVREAARLARAHPEITFFVLTATHRLRRNDVLIEPLGARSYFEPTEAYDDGIPF